MTHGNHYHGKHEPAHKTLGRCLKTMRQRLQESLGETSGAVEIAVEQLDRYERGAELPSEDILMLLINHFDLSDEEAVRLWDLAGYEQDFIQARPPADDNRGQEPALDAVFNEGQLRQTMHVMLLAMDNRVMYTNGAEIISDNAGLVINFAQNLSTIGSSTNDKHAQASQNVVVSRIGMSYDQAEQLLQTLQKALLHKQYLSGPPQLPPTTT